jgi:hypothetical protein
MHDVPLMEGLWDRVGTMYKTGIIKAFHAQVNTLVIRFHEDCDIRAKMQPKRHGPRWPPHLVDQILTTCLDSAFGIVPCRALTSSRGAMAGGSTGDEVRVRLHKRNFRTRRQHGLLKLGKIVVHKQRMRWDIVQTI